MDRSEYPFIALAPQATAEDFAALTKREVSGPMLESNLASAAAASAPSVARLQGFNLLEQPLITGLTMCPGQVLVARSVVPLRSALIGREVVVLFDRSDFCLPIIIGVIEPHPLASDIEHAAPGVAVRVDGERHVIEAQREIVLRCGDASITLTRAGKVIIKGNYILSRSTGYNKIKGAAIDIN